ncbi:hypothetical protein HSBAA_33850 [Vreelandella sulfidaeris]|uniref:Alkyl hydroperoxide reductase subunit C/ Thiol specific antioxidant domain-containing protein n=1 Tax=Vreelandella sulfidaeris TaxID=115553 RepID=A0A455UCA4_9GAMM|nr:hypothetical protein HSBAA_33850 [Halomonas sulfidaeris]
MADAGYVPGSSLPHLQKYLGQINDMKADFDNMNVQIVAVSTDPEEKAKKFADEVGLNFDVAYGLGIDQARDLGLYISTPWIVQRPINLLPNRGCFHSPGWWTTFCGNL